jgi:hypothetical protein
MRQLSKVDGVVDGWSGGWMEWWMISVDEVVEEKSGRVRREGIK